MQRKKLIIVVATLLFSAVAGIAIGKAFPYEHPTDWQPVPYWDSIA